MPVVMKFAHSVMFALPRITAPASRSRVTRKASRGAMQSFRASEPALVCSRSAVAMLSFRREGNTVQRPADAARGALPVERFGDLARLGVHLEHGVEPRAAAVVGLDALQEPLRSNEPKSAGRPAWPPAAP